MRCLSGYKCSFGVMESNTLNVIQEASRTLHLLKLNCQWYLITDTEQRGTCVQFFPDSEIFQETLIFSKDVLARRLQELAFLNPGLKIVFKDERVEWEAEYQYEGGIREYVEYLNQSKTTLHDDVVYVTGGIKMLK